MRSPASDDEVSGPAGAAAEAPGAPGEVPEAAEAPAIPGAAAQAAAIPGAAQGKRSHKDEAKATLGRAAVHRLELAL